ncbi:MAG: AAA family ATPase [[Clostridium] symbiosum]
MKKVEINLCGNPTIFADGEKVNFPYKKVEGFLYYLCIRKTVTREEVICLLWGDEDETTGKKKLRDAVYQVRRFIDKDFLVTTGHTGIALNPDYPVMIDLERREDGDVGQSGVFLDHFYIKNCYEFEEWVEGVREGQRQNITKSAREHLDDAREKNDLSLIQKYSNILIKNDPYNEELYYEIMNVYAENGNYTMAIRLYYDLMKLFQDDLDMEPSQKVKDLFHRVFNVKEHVKTEGVSVDLPFIGRKKELYEISGFLERSAGEKVGCLAVEGEEGVGKTSFLECGLKLALGKQMITLYAVCYRQGADFFLNPWNDIFQEVRQCIVKTEGVSVDLPFIGRKKELYEISGFLERSAGEKVGCLAVEGEEGVGKTSFLECGLKLALGKQMITLYAVCYRQGADFFLNPWNDIFQEVRQCIENGTMKGALSLDEEEKLSQLLNRGVGDDRESGRLTYQMIEKTVISLFTEITKKYRIVLAFDDIQWMDQMSFQLMCRLQFMLEPDVLLTICTYNRSSEAEVTEALEPLVRRDSVKLIALQPFTKEETDEILHKSLPELDTEPEKRQKLYELTDGNAFFLTEMINIIREKGYTLEKSPKTNFVIKARLSGISQDEKEVLDCMSVFPEKISIEEIELLMKGMDRLTLLKILERLQEGFLIKEVLVGWNVYYKFVHRIFQEYIYEKQSNGKKQLYHKMLAAYYEAQAEQDFTVLPLVVYHYDKCHDQVKAYQYQIRYLKEFYTVINENFPVLHTEASDFGDDFGVMAEAAKMLELAEDVINLKDDSREIRQMKMEMHYIKGRYDIAMGDYDSGIANIEKSIFLAQKLNAHKNLLACYKQQVFHGIQREDLEKVDKYVTLGLGCIKKEERDEYATFLRLKGWYHVQRQEYRMAEDVLQKALMVFRELEDGGGKYTASIAACFNYIGDIYRIQDRYDEALEYYMKGITVGQGPVETNGIGQVYCNIGQVMYCQGRLLEAWNYLERARECLEKNGYRWGLERAETYLAMTCLKTGRKEEAAEHYSRAVGLSAKIGNPTTEQLLEAVKREMN